ncbi:MULTISPECIES: benzoate 1,2-dioxygenase electron transfer component BenC [Mycolicibacter]|uniref:Benzoate 1,2-dioxygenase electron transfer component BenC n=2 Tax=Mycolicibacter TaxID=1073531 RepID=A0ABU5XK34_9MYCO|nr:MULTISPECIES: benzoate 1,2-dioxygenase electron transfer component BenC [unclassified Mycolicibacter]MEB3022625.1 benzoate 1,2-dioxygenase electron transfer component BenC [Mycolicibacter sp. MYC098]MEB3070416.1 benzoate 1,2-dioxygenase electron transfer component BenC [Mycolicibacter sp. MYC017]
MTVTSHPETSADTTDAAPLHQVALGFEDGVTRFINCAEDQTVAGASYRQRINIPVDCLDGVCGTCKAFCESGTYELGDYVPDALTEDEAAAGYCLPCVMKPRSDVVLQIRSTSEVAKTQAGTFSGTLVTLERLSPTTMLVGLEIAHRAELTFLPGQYANIVVPGASPTEKVSRSYSFSNAPNDDRLTFLVKLTPGGAMSTYLTDRAAVGDPIEFTGPHGSFFLRETERPVLLLAGGTGLAPVLAILRKLRDDGSRRRAHLIYGVSTDDDLVELDALAELATGLPGFSWDYCVSDPDSSAPNRGPDKAHVTSLIAPEHLYDGDVATYVCGPPPMVEAVRKHLTDGDVALTGFYYEKFALAVPGASEAPAAETAAEPGGLPSPAVPAEDLLTAPDARAVIGQVMLPAATIDPWPDAVVTTPEGDTARRILGQPLTPAGAGGVTVPLDEGGPLSETGARSVLGQELFAAVSTPGPSAAPTVPAPTVAPDGYQIGEEHPAVHESDAIFEAREALELGAVELTLGRLTSQQLTGYRLLAESTLPYVDGDRLVDATQYTETNAAFHEYLFTLTGNEHLLQAYQALGVKGRMGEVLRNATWCHPLCAQDHVDIVAAFEAGDRTGARGLISAHADRAKQTMRRAMADALAERRPRFITPGRFAGKVVVVTGAAQGIGERTARRINAEGGTLVLADRSALVDELARELAEEPVAGSPQTLAVTVDLEQPEGATDLVQQALSRFGRIDVLINNVGGAINFKPFTEFSGAEIRAELDRSLLTTLFACRAVLPSMVTHGQGVIVNVSSAATRGVNRIPYSAAKGGINAITASLAMEYADAGIRVCATAPGGTQAPPRRISRGTPEAGSDTERAWFQAHIDQTIDSSLLKRYGTLDEQAAAICFLASDEASYITGTVLPVAGGDQG